MKRHSLTYLLISFFAVILVSCGTDVAQESSEQNQSQKTESQKTLPEETQQTTETSESSGSEIPAKKSIKVGFVYSSPVGDHGWTFAHDQGRKYMEDQLGKHIETSTIEDVSSGESGQVFRNLSQRDYDLIFGTSFGFMDPMLNTAQQFPNTVYMHASGFKTHNNMGNYFIRIYQPSYLAGMLAAHKTDKDIIGYVAPHPIPEVVRIINAFTLGARAVDPNVSVRVVWTNTWYDPGTERDAATSLLDSGIDVLGHFQNSPAVLQAAKQENAYSFGMASDMGNYAPENHLASVQYNWGPYYVQFVEQVLKGTWEAGQWWGGMSDNLIDLDNINQQANSQKALEAVQEARSKLKKQGRGRLNVFEGPIKDRNGNLKIQDGTELTDSAKWSMYWFVEGVKGNLPERE